MVAQDMNTHAFSKRVHKYGQTVTIYWKPSTDASNKCTCWEDGYPDPDCIICGGDGYMVAVASTTTKAFVQDFKKRIGERVILGESTDYIRSGRKRFYFLPHLIPLNMNYIDFTGDHYRVLEHGEWLIGNDVIYTWATCEVID